MRVLLDACVIFPTIMREMLIGAASQGLFEPIWSERIIEEWVRATRRLGEGADLTAKIEAATMSDRFKEARVDHTQTEGLWLPDENDIHVLAAAIAGNAEVLLTNNLGDFPTRILAQHNILRRDPDGFLIDLFQDHPDQIIGTAEVMHAKAEKISGREQSMRGLLKRSGLPRLGKALSPK